MATSKSRRGRGKKRRARACGSKVAYAKEAAIAAAVALTKKAGVRFNAYKCPFCHLPSGACAWHVGHRATLRRRLS
jgi:cytochrome c5